MTRQRSASRRCCINSTSLSRGAGESYAWVGRGGGTDTLPLTSCCAHQEQEISTSPHCMATSRLIFSLIDSLPFWLLFARMDRIHVINVNYAMPNICMLVDQYFTASAIEYTIECC